MKIKYFLLFAFIISHSVFSNDPSTPLNGNLFVYNESGFKPSKTVIYNNDSELLNRGLTIQKERIFRNETEPGLTLIIEDIHTDSDISQFTSDGYVVLTGNDNRYGHGIFGKKENPTGFTIVKNNTIIESVELTGNSVFETTRALIADIIPENEGDEIILTTSNIQGGTRLEVYSFTGHLLGFSNEIGQGYRWLHLLAAAPFDSSDSVKLAVVKTPHIGGILQIYKWNGEKLEIESSLGNLSTHQIGSDNLNMALASDFTGDGDTEFIIPSRNYSELQLIKYNEGNWEILKSFKLPGQLNTNIYFDQDFSPSLWVGTTNGFYVNIVN